ATSPADEAPKGRSLAKRGQVLVIYMMSIFVIVGLLGLVIDVAWYWTNSLRVQRAADAAALAGAVDLPAKPGTVAAHALGTGIGDAIAEASKNGYTGLTFGCAADGATPSSNPGICVHVDTGNTNQLDVMISAPVNTFFMRVFGISSLTASRDAAAVFTLPVPMGSPDNYYGVFGPVRGATFTTHVGMAGPNDPIVAGGTWTNPTNVDGKAGPNNSTYAVSPPYSSAAASTQQWTNFNLTSGTPAPPGTVIPAGAKITGIEVAVNAMASVTPTTCLLQASVTYSGGTSTWVSSPAFTAPATTEQTLSFGSASNTTAWGAHTFVQGDFANGVFNVGLRWKTSVAGCGTTTTASVDWVSVRVSYTTTTTPTTATPGSGYDLAGPGTACSTKISGAPTDCYLPNGVALTARGFWAAMNTKGISSGQGDAFQSDLDPSGATAPNCSTVAGLRSCYDPTNYYNYAITMPPGSTNGWVYVFDPVFCDEGSAYGVGDGQSSGSLSATNPPSSWFELFDTNNTTYTNNDDTLVTTTGPTFLDMKYSDSTMSGASPSGSLDCKERDTSYGDARDYHDHWILLNPMNPLTGGSDGETYRLHTTNSTPPGQTDAVNQSLVGTEQNFALYATADGGTPSIYGLGAMEMYTPLTASGTTNSQFYLAQIPAYYAGKTLELNLWDAGDISPLTGNLYVMMPSTTVGTWTSLTFNYTAASPAGSCSPPSSSGNGAAYAVTRNSGGASLNNCWLTIDVTIPTTYTAPQNGWWQIKYAMSGTGTSTDTTTWTAHILGNPVHLVVP
ncbi:MAG TPA: pilus assembly protein TadG-related protein, partial [Acidimicrobiales bacterium]|nr:pilus assembly protein TadG-related protein [Acidimicrobiales bacterium]